ncbi:MAG: [FeFe] hydrogenase H-cluster radical SAM maturase HydE [Caldisericia bacterium]|nr:[FeFe] hydrogenase H-cluster radical SAM maturase HydE [Caldisericia bacterium]MDD4614233.1 [FeFe] hydrogenase H-cluster radical SAM maturase HydE [Caldisericia bacterium]
MSEIYTSKKSILHYLHRKPCESLTIEDRQILSQCRILTDKYYQNQVFLRGIIEFSSFCSQDCLYCGLRAANTNLPRYRLSLEDILSTVQRIYSDGLRSVVLQSGEDLFYTTSLIAHVCAEILDRYPDIAITLSIGERNSPAYRKLRKSGATRFLIKHETANPILYKQIHPTQELLSRLRQQQLIKQSGFMLGSGFLVGLPHQTIEDIYDELLFLYQNQFDMWGIGVFIPSQGTPFENYPNGDPNLAKLAMVCSRLFDPQTMIPITTAYHSLMGDADTIQSLHDVANVFMINYTPDSVKNLYHIYNNKQSLTLEKTCQLIEKAGKIPTYTKGEPSRVNNKKPTTSYWYRRTNECR